MLANGRGLPRDDAAAAEWFRKAADQGFPQAQFNLASFYASGRGVQRDDAVAAGWFERAAMQDLAPAQHNLGLMYEYGRGVPRDPAKALAWYEKAAAQGFPPARDRRQVLLGTGGAVAASAPVAAAREARRRPEAAPEGAGRGSDETAWVAAQPPAAYTLQIASFLDPADARRFLERELAGREAGVYAATKRGQRWYSVVSGRFPDQASARAAAESLPGHLHKLKPWPRRFATIQAEMRRP
jgi:TPR repeat protein